MAQEQKEDNMFDQPQFSLLEQLTLQKKASMVLDIAAKNPQLNGIVDIATWANKGKYFDYSALLQGYKSSLIPGHINWTIVSMLITYGASPSILVSDFLPDATLAVLQQEDPALSAKILSLYVSLGQNFAKDLFNSVTKTVLTSDEKTLGYSRFVKLVKDQEIFDDAYFIEIIQTYFQLYVVKIIEILPYLFPARSGHELTFNTRYYSKMNLLVYLCKIYDEMPALSPGKWFNETQFTETVLNLIKLCAKNGCYAKSEFIKAANLLDDSVYGRRLTTSMRTAVLEGGVEAARVRGKQIYEKLSIISIDEIILLAKDDEKKEELLAYLNLFLKGYNHEDQIQYQQLSEKLSTFFHGGVGINLFSHACRTEVSYKKLHKQIMEMKPQRFGDGVLSTFSKLEFDTELELKAPMRDGSAAASAAGSESMPSSNSSYFFHPSKPDIFSEPIIESENLLSSVSGVISTASQT